MLKALVLDIPQNYDFVIHQVLSSVSDDPEGMDDLLVQSFISFLMEGCADVYIDSLLELLPELDEFDMDSDVGDDVIGEWLDSIDGVHFVSPDDGHIHGYVVNPESDEAGKRLIIRALALSFWQYLREYVLHYDFEKVQDDLHETSLQWLQDLDDDRFEQFLNDDLDADWLYNNMTAKCWHYDDADRVESMDDLVK